MVITADTQACESLNKEPFSLTRRVAPRIWNILLFSVSALEAGMVKIF